MDGNRYAVAFHYPGTLSADISGAFTLPTGMALSHVSATAENDSDATLAIGDAGDADGVLTAATIGDSGTPKEFTASDFDGALVDSGPTPYHYDNDDREVHFTLDYDGATGTAAQDVVLVFTFLEG